MKLERQKSLLMICYNKVDRGTEWIESVEKIDRGTELLSIFERIIENMKCERLFENTIKYNIP